MNNLKNKFIYHRRIIIEKWSELKANRDLDEEHQFIETNRIALIGEYGEGKFIVVKRGKIIGPYKNHKKAYEQAHKIFGNICFYIKELLYVDNFVHIPYYRVHNPYNNNNLISNNNEHI